MKKILLFLALAWATGLSAQVYLDVNAPIEERVEDALSRMTLREKINMIHAQSKFSSAGVPRLGIPEVWCTDGPHGVRAEVLWDEWNTANWTNDSITAFPALTCLAATWNPDMSARYGKAIGEEALYRGKTVLLGPGVNIYRTPLNGRNFEYMGEDPYLSSRMVIPYVQEVQKNGVAVCVKHYALNNQENGRHVTNVHVSDRALYEIYLPAFKAAVQEGGAWSVMGAYNRYQDHWCCQNDILLNRILRKEWGFDGAVISDWGGVNNTDEAITGGLDLEFGSWTDGLTMGRTNAYDVYYLANPYMERIQSGKVGTEELDNKCRNVLRMIFRTTMSGKRGFGNLCSDEHRAAAREIAGEGIVLLQNRDNVLPIRPAELSTKHSTHGPIMTTDLYTPVILVVGENAIKPLTVGGGSSSLKAKYEISPLQGIRERAGREADVRWVRGYVGTGATKQDGMIVGAELEDKRPAAEVTAEAVEAAKQADIVIFVGGLNKEGHQDCEGVDRLAYDLPYGQNAVIEAIAAVNPNLVFVNISGNAVAMPWLNKVPAVLQAWFNGSEAGHALADVLFGDVNPSGKMPFTIMPALTDYPAHQMGAEVYPGVPSDKRDATHPDLMEEYYKEDLFVGYRYVDLSPKARKALTGVACKAQPLFAFGHGLSYTTFEYGKATIAGNVVTLTVTNTGSMAGKEVVQLYVAPKKASVTRPVKELKAFSKMMLKPGETRTVSFTLTEDMFQYFDEAKHAFVTDHGAYTIRIGASSTDIRTQVMYTL